MAALAIRTGIPGEDVSVPWMTATERARLVRLCTLLTGEREAAEDLAQETLYEAWRHADRLRDPLRRAQWLDGIARNVCRRWSRSRGREALCRDHWHGDLPAGGGALDSSAEPLDPNNLEIALERDELATLLDRALALLPATTRDVLIARYIHESPHAAIAARLGLSEGAVKVRLGRGRLALRRVLATDLRPEAVAHGLIAPDNEGWQETRIWCPSCGNRRLIGRFPRGEAGGAYQLRCPGCHPEPDVFFANYAFDHAHGASLGGVQGFKPALSRLMIWADDFYRRGLRERVAVCPRCGGPSELRIFAPEDPPPFLRARRGVISRCVACGCRTDQGLHGVLLMTPEGQRFWRAHPRLRTLPTREVGDERLVTRLMSVTGTATLDIICRRDTYEVTGIHGDLPPARAHPFDLS